VQNRTEDGRFGTSAIVRGDQPLMPILVAAATVAVTVPMTYGFVTMKSTE